MEDNGGWVRDGVGARATLGVCGLCCGVERIEEDGERVGATIGNFGFGVTDGVFVSDAADAGDILGVCCFKYGIGCTNEDVMCWGYHRGLWFQS